MIKQFLLKKLSTKGKNRNTPGVLVNNIEKIEYPLTYFFKTQNADDTVIRGMIETSCKDLISSVICVGALQMLNLVANFDLR